MQLYERQVSLKLSPHPLRLVCIVNNRQELLTAVKLYTHTWGGRANTILPMPSNDQEANTLKAVLKRLHPDYIFVSTEQEIPFCTNEVLDEFSQSQLSISSHAVDEHLSGDNPILLPTGSFSVGLYNGNLPHIGPILGHLHPAPLTVSKIRLTELCNHFSFELSIHTGTPTQSYQNYLKKHLGAQVLSAPETIEQLVRTSLILAVRKNPISLTMLQVNRSQEIMHFHENWIDQSDGLHLFLDDGKEIGIPTAFWNSRWQKSYNKLFFPREAFIQNLEPHITLIAEAMLSLRYLVITTSLDHEDAIALGRRFVNAFKSIGREVLVEVVYCNFRFDAFNGANYWGQQSVSTYIVSPDGSIRFNPPVPIGHENQRFVFGYDAEVTLASGRKLSLPATPSSAVLLSNSSSSIQRFEEKQGGFSRKQLEARSSVRPMISGIAGTAMPGVECRFYIPSDDVVITQQLEDAGFKVRPNDHTRHATSFIRRFGSLEETINLVDRFGVDVISALSHLRADQSGLEWDDIISFLVQERHWSNKEVKTLLKPKLKNLLSIGLIRRGYSLQCSTCEFKDWFPIEEVSEHIKCKACTESFQLPMEKLSFACKANELAVRLVKGGGLAVIMTAALLRQVDYSSFIQFGGDLLETGEKSNSVEVDIFCLSKSSFIIAECKSEHDLNEIKLTKIKTSLEKTINTAPRINAKVVILGIATNSSNLSNLFQLVDEVSEKAQEQKIGFHLILNWRFYLWGREEIEDPRKLSPEDLQLDESPLVEERSVRVNELSIETIQALTPVFSSNVLNSWEERVIQGKDMPND